MTNRSFVSNSAGWRIPPAPWPLHWCSNRYCITWRQACVKRVENGHYRGGIRGSNLCYLAL